MIITIEGIDGAGKNTLTRALTQRIEATQLAFPRYEESMHAQLAARALHGEMGDLIDSAYGMATMFALDRAGALEQLLPFVKSQDVLLLDRYVASNAAYSIARLEDEKVGQWIHDLEFETLKLPKPDLQVLLDTPVEVAADRAARREAIDESRTRDRYESDGGLQARTAAAYRRLAESEWGGPWLVTNHNSTPEDIAEQIVQRIANNYT